MKKIVRIAVGIVAAMALYVGMLIHAGQRPGGLAAARSKEQAAPVSRRTVAPRRAINRVALQKIREREAQRDETDFKPLDQVIASKEADRYTQTEAHMQLPEVRRLIEQQYNIVPYLNLISTMLANEGKYKNTHYVFYHTTGNAYRLTQDLYTQLYAALHPEENVGSRFKFLRFNNEAVNSTAHGWLVNELKEKGLVNDNAEAGAILLSVNLALFGNVGFEGESTWHYFLHPGGRKLPDRSKYEQMMTNFGLTHEYIDEIMSLFDIYDTQEDTLLQIFVPKEKLDQIGYLAWVKGIPAHQEVIDLIKSQSKTTRFNKVKVVMEDVTKKFAEEQKNNPLYTDMMKSVEAGDFSLESYLKVYRNRPWELTNINDVTGRLLFTPDVLLNPESGVEIRRFSTVHRDKLKEYKARLNEVVDKLLADKEARDSSK